MKTSWICGLVVVLTALPVWGKELPPALDIAFDAAKIRDSRIQSTPAQGEVLQKIALLLSDDAIGEAEALWEGFVVDLVKSGEPRDIDTLVLWIIRSAYFEPELALRDLANKVRFFNDLKIRLRGEIEDARNILIDLTSPKEIAVLLKIIEDLEAVLIVCQDEAELTTLDLQGALQKIQGILRALSNTSKVFHDLALSVIRTFR